MNVIEERFRAWIARVEEIVGHTVDEKRAYDAFMCDMYPKKSLTAEEYAAELKRALCRH